MSRLAVIVLAAGKGKRFHSELPKVLHEAAGVPMLHWVLRAVRGMGEVDRVLVVVGHGRELVAASVRGSFEGVELVHQPAQRGTGDAVAQCRDALEEFAGELLVLPGDAPLIDSGSLRALVDEHRRQGAAVSLLTAVLPDPAGYGRIVREPADRGSRDRRGRQGDLIRIVEHADASPEILAVDEVSTGIWCFDAALLFPALDHLSPDNAQGELYLPDAAPLIQEAGGVMVTVTGDPDAVRGVNDRTQLADAARVLEARGRAGVRAGSEARDGG